MSESVSRETPPAPEAAAGVFSSALSAAERYAALLAGPGVERGLIGPREVPRLWERHLMNCAVVERVIPQGMAVADVGSGAGLPGVVVALCRPDLRMTLVEPLLRRTRFLSEVVEELGLENVEVLRARAEELHGTRDFDVVTSRAVAPLERLVRWSLPLVRPGGAMVAMKGASARSEIEAAAPVLDRLGAGAVEVLSLGGDVIDEPTTVVRVEATAPSQLGWASVERDQGTSSGREGRRRKRERRRRRTDEPPSRSRAQHGKDG